MTLRPRPAEPDEEDSFVCSHCRAVVWGDPSTCPHCGAEFEDDEDDEEFEDDEDGIEYDDEDEDDEYDDDADDYEVPEDEEAEEDEDGDDDWDDETKEESDDAAAADAPRDSESASGRVERRLAANTRLLSELRRALPMSRYFVLLVAAGVLIRPYFAIRAPWAETVVDDFVPTSVLVVVVCHLVICGLLLNYSVRLFRFHRKPMRRRLQSALVSESILWRIVLFLIVIPMVLYSTLEFVIAFRSIQEPY